jgi:oligoribonuclease NrnB/cAMP/cGMP phosphodiesterase (DHH superfamily)
MAKDLAAAPLTVVGAMEKYKIWKAKDEALAAKISTAEGLLSVIDKRFMELKETQADAVEAVLQRKLNELEEETAAKKKKEALLKGQIDSLKKEPAKPKATNKSER